MGADPGDQVQGDGEEVIQGWGKAGELYKAGKDSLCWGFCRCTKLNWKFFGEWKNWNC